MTDPHAGMRQPGVCEGFRWVGQPFHSCDRCGEPYWLHTHEERPRRNASLADLLGGGAFEQVPITPKQATAVKAKWGRRG